MELLSQSLALAARMNVLEARKSDRILSLRKGAQNGSTEEDRKGRHVIDGEPDRGGRFSYVKSETTTSA